MAAVPTTVNSPTSLRPSFTTLDNSYTFLILKSADSSAKCLVHKDLLCKYSRYVHKLFNSGFFESKTGPSEIVVNCQDPKTIYLLADWLYYGRLPGPSEDPREDEDEVNVVGEGEVEMAIERLEIVEVDASSVAKTNTLADEAELCSPPSCHWELSLIYLASLADFYDISHLRSAILKSLHGIYADSAFIPFYTSIARAFEVLPHASPICRLLVDVYAAKFEPGSDSEEERKVSRMLPWEFWYRVLLKMARARREGVWIEGLENYAES